ncbi:MAG: chemotaxis protein CheW [Candidatus Omnitrophota bacterium]
MEILTFKLANEELAIDVKCVREVLRPRKIYSFPRAPEFIEGVIDLRGRVLAVIDLRKKFDMPLKHEISRWRVVVCAIKGLMVGFIVDSVNDVIAVSSSMIQPPPAVVSSQLECGYLCGVVRIEKKVIMLLDVEKLINTEEIERLLKTKTGQ